MFTQHRHKVPSTARIILTSVELYEGEDFIRKTDGVVFPSSRVAFSSTVGVGRICRGSGCTIEGCPFHNTKEIHTDPTR
ncbi:hypothetical protein E2C01_039816 [Portunus trituberculatus]|uniref:Uncharacterized protein n=1 Tax=Portunus trituberculatus TaxID=210409 RepID=A0A5B7FM96_PORTR|nr:hypothetical protein [Portunus trituberculatus]